MQRTKIKFVTKFVDELYVILIGVGLVNVIFGLDPLEHPTVSILMALFVTTVVLLYWWDWKATFEESVVSSRTEFAIDLLLLIALVFLFRYYDNPIRLGLVFVAIGFLDLLWVINYSVRSRGDHGARRRAWIGEKVLVIAIYSATWLLLRTAVSDWPVFAQDALIVSAVAIVRFVGFRQAKKGARISFRAAESSDAVVIAQINNEHFRAVGSQGFLITEIEPAGVADRIADESSLYFVAESASGEIQGFVELYREPDDEVRESEWADPALHRRFEAINSVYIAKIGVSANAARLGIGKFLYDRLKVRYKSDALYAFVVLKPILNTPSLKFHESMGFERVASFHRASFDGLSPYASALMVCWPLE